MLGEGDGLGERYRFGNGNGFGDGDGLVHLADIITQLKWNHFNPNGPPVILVVTMRVTLVKEAGTDTPATVRRP